ncbi:MAG: pre-peptidase C-terminal domain-containing protein, partial [Singulisphaera sp.]
EVAPILVRKCQGCHNAKKAEGGLDITTFSLLKAGGEKAGDLILEPGDPDASHLIELVRPGGAPRMPYKLPPLSPTAIQTLERWVLQGAKFDGPSESETPIASLVDPLAGLPEVALKVPAADPVTALAYTPDGKTLAAAVGRRVLLFDASSGKPKADLGEHPGPVTSLRITPDGGALIAAGGRPGMFGSVTVWDLAKATRRHDLRGHRDAILAADLAPDGRTLATASYDRTLIVWDLSRGEPLRTLKDHTDAVYAVAFAPDGKTLASAGADRTVKLWDISTGKRLRTLSDATAELYAVTFGAGGKTVLAGGVDRSIRAWQVADPEAPLVNSVFAHSAAVLRLVTSNGKTLVSSGEDKDVKVWDLATLKPLAAIPGGSDWPQSLAVSPDGHRIAIGRYDGSLAIHDAATGRLAVTARAVPEPPPAAKPVLIRNASLNPPSPRGAARGTKRRVTLTGTGVGKATTVLFVEPGLGRRSSRSRSPTRTGSVSIWPSPPMPASACIGSGSSPRWASLPSSPSVSAHPEAAEAEPGDDPAGLEPITLPSTFVGTISRPADTDQFRFRAEEGQQLVFDPVAKSLASKLNAHLTLIDDRGGTLAEATPSEGGFDPVLTSTVPRDGTYILRVADTDYAGSGAHFYRIAAGSLPLVTSVFPLGVERGQTTSVHVLGPNLDGVSSVPMPVAPGLEPGAVIEVPVTLPEGHRPIGRRSVVVAEGPQGVEAEPNDAPSEAGSIATPGGVSARIGREGDVDHFRFEARKGRRLIVEVFGRRLGTAIDPVIEILDARGGPVPRAVLRPVAQTEVAFRDHDSTVAGIRLSQWNNLAIDDPVLIGRELIRIQDLPRNPDDNCVFWNAQGQRIGLLETTPEHHPMGQPIYKVEVHPPGTTFPAGGVPPVTLNYRNDDGGPGFAKDARLTFDPPADGTYVVRVEDVRGQGGDGFGYHLVVRTPRPDFQLTLGTEDPNVPRGGTALVTAVIRRLDGFDAPVDVTVEGSRRDHRDPGPDRGGRPGRHPGPLGGRDGPRLLAADLAGDRPRGGRERGGRPRARHRSRRHGCGMDHRDPRAEPQALRHAPPRRHPAGRARRDDPRRGPRPGVCGQGSHRRPQPPSWGPCPEHRAQWRPRDGGPNSAHDLPLCRALGRADGTPLLCRGQGRGGRDGAQLAADGAGRPAP